MKQCGLAVVLTAALGAGTTLTIRAHAAAAGAPSVGLRPPFVMSFPKIISARTDDAARTEWA